MAATRHPRAARVWLACVEVAQAAQWASPAGELVATQRGGPGVCLGGGRARAERGAGGVPSSIVNRNSRAGQRADPSPSPAPLIPSPPSDCHRPSPPTPSVARLARLEGTCRRASRTHAERGQRTWSRRAVLKGAGVSCRLMADTVPSPVILFTVHRMSPRKRCSLAVGLAPPALNLCMCMCGWVGGVRVCGAAALVLSRAALHSFRHVLPAGVALLGVLALNSLWLLALRGVREGGE